MNFSEIQFKDYGKCLKVDNGIIEAIITLDVGPRIISFSFIGGRNIMASNRQAFGKTSGKEFDEYYFEGAYFENLGGHRFWISPESFPETYYPDALTPVEYEINANTITVKQAPQKENGVCLWLEITMSEDNEMTVKHYAKNIGETAKEFAIWPLTVLDKGGVEIIPLNTHDTGLLHNRKIILWPYAKMNDERVNFLQKYITIKQNPKNTDAFKLGVDTIEGKGYYVIDDVVFKKTYDFIKGAKYPDDGACYECYLNDVFIEFETLSPLYNVAPNEVIEHTEVFSLYKKPCDFNEKSEESVDEFLNRLI